MFLNSIYLYMLVFLIVVFLIISFGLIFLVWKGILRDICWEWYFDMYMNYIFLYDGVGGVMFKIIKGKWWCLYKNVYDNFFFEMKVCIECFWKWDLWVWS